MSFSPGHVRAAVVTMRSNRWRSLLTMFGIIVGVASVIVIIGISQGVKSQITGQVNSYSKNVITVQSKTTNLNSVAGVSTLPTVSTLTDQDVNQISKINGVQAAVPLEIFSGLASADHPFPNGIVIATTEQLPEVLNQTIAFGTFFSNQYSNIFSAVLGSNAVLKMFNENIPLGASFTWRGQPFIVDGAFNSFSVTPFSNNTVFNNAIFIPISAAQQLAPSSSSILQILVRVRSAKQLNQVDKQINSALLSTHSGQSNFSVLLPTQLAQSNTGILNLLTELTIGIAIISLFVGGVGIMNVMLVSVTERMHEIGIRKAVGASNSQILSQFLVEATTVSVTGGIIGIILAVLGDTGLRLATNLTPSLNWQIIVIAAFISIVIGIVFGSVPAFRASRKEPIDALRND